MKYYGSEKSLGILGKPSKYYVVIWALTVNPNLVLDCNNYRLNPTRYFFWLF